jgi:hypothetical protein
VRIVPGLASSFSGFVSANFNQMTKRAKPANILRGIVLGVCFGAVSWHSAAIAQTAQLPLFSACAPATPPTLPARWRTVGLMMPFLLEGQLDVGEFVYDATIPAMRATVYGLESGAVDLLITDTDTYQFLGPYRSPNGCTSLGRKFSPPSAHWLSEPAVCVGEAPLATTAVQWWKAQGVDSQANWHWFKAGTRLPWRSVFMSRSPDPAVIGDYAMTYFPIFEELPETNLSPLRDFCVSQVDQNRPEATAAAQTARAHVHPQRGRRGRTAGAGWNADPRPQSSSLRAHDIGAMARSVRHDGNAHADKFQ